MSQRVPADFEASLGVPFVKLAAGMRLADKYVLQRQLGGGGMGVVWAALDEKLGRRVALKLLHPNLLGDEAALARFILEARATGSLGSEHLATVFDTGKTDFGVPFLAMELLEGDGLDAILRNRGTLPIDTAVSWVLEACLGIAEAHARGIVHRDLKPGNLFVTRCPDGRSVVKVLDFGIAKSLDALDTDGPSLTRTCTTLGTPGYMSPEQLRSSKSVDVRTDIWSLGLVLHRSLTGESAFPAENAGEYFAMIIGEAPVPLRAQLPDAPAGLERIVLQCLAKDPDRRYQDVGGLARALARFAPPAAEAIAARVEKVLVAHGVPRRESPSPTSPDSEASTLAASAETSLPAAWSRRRRLAWMFAGGAVLTLGAAVALRFAAAQAPRGEDRSDPSSLVGGVASSVVSAESPSTPIVPSAALPVASSAATLEPSTDVPARRPAPARAAPRHSASSAPAPAPTQEPLRAPPGPVEREM